MFTDLILLAVGLAILVVGANTLISGATKIAARLGVSTVVIGLTVVAFGTSTPELVVSVKAALMGSDDVAIGNVVGSNIFNILPMIGLGVLLQPVETHRSFQVREFPIMIGSSLLFFFFALNGSISRFEGACLVLLLVGYVLFHIWNVRREGASQLIDAEELRELAEVQRQPLSWDVLKEVGLVVGGLIGLVFGGDLVVTHAQSLARSWGVPELIIGVTLVAVGTSLPELATTVVAAIKKEGDLLVGNAVGSNTFNILSVIGFSAMITPLVINPSVLKRDLPWLLGTAVLVWLVTLYRPKIDRRIGVAFVLLYLVYIAQLVS